MLRLDLRAARVRIEAPVTYWSAVGWHRFGRVQIIPAGPGQSGAAATVAELLAREAGGAAAEIADLVARVADSTANIAWFLAARHDNPADPSGTTPFLSSEQALILGHPLHPVPKSRDGLTDAELAAYSPEMRGSFQLHWFAADPAIVSSDCAWPETAEKIVADRTGAELVVPAGRIAIPAHPWQARDLLERPGIRKLLDDGLLEYLGPGGLAWHPTSSLRTVYQPGAPVMLKLSLGLRITNSRRENLRKELRRGVEAHRLLEAGLGARLAAEHPGFAIVRDPGWLAVDLPDSALDRPGPAPAVLDWPGPAAAASPDSGLDVVLRESPFGLRDLARCVAGLVAEQPGVAPSMLVRLVNGLAVRSRRPVPEVAREWFARYLEAVAAPVLWLYAEYGIALEAHQQNTLVVLNQGGWPVGGRYRDNQGYYFAASRAAQLCRWLPHAGEDSDSIVDDAVVDERLGYYLGVNNLMGLIGAFGSQGLADERLLLSDLRVLLTRFATGGKLVPGVIPALLDGGMLRCKANLLTRVGGMDELAEPLATQSVYVEIPNPLAEAGHR
jgi:siderophore synthetase component